MLWDTLLPRDIYEPKNRDDSHKAFYLAIVAFSICQKEVNNDAALSWWRPYSGSELDSLHYYCSSFQYIQPGAEHASMAI